MDSLNFNSVEDLPGLSARAIFKVNSSSVFKEDVDIAPTLIDDKFSYILWGGDNQMPFDILSLIKKDETLATCQCFNAEVCYDSDLLYDTCIATVSVKNEVEDFLLDNDLPRLTFSVSVRTSSNLASLSQYLFSMKTAQKLCDFLERKPVTVALLRLTLRAKSRRFFTPTGAKSYLHAPTSR